MQNGSVRTHATIARRARIAGCALALATLAAPAFAQQGSTFWVAGGGAADPKIKDWKAGAQLRTLYFDQSPETGPDSEAWAAGGWVYGQSPYFFDLLSFGATGYGSLPLWKGEDAAATNMIQPNGNGIAVFGEAFARLQYARQGITLYRQIVDPRYPVAGGVRANRADLAFVGKRDVRMVPLTYEAAMASGTLIDSLRYFAGYVWNVKDINSENFISMSEKAGGIGADEGMWMGGVQWAPIKDLWLQGWYHYVQDTLTMTFVDADYVNRPSKEWYWRLGTQYAHQGSTGADLLTGSSFSTWNWGAYAETGWKFLKGYGAYSTTGDGANIRTPYSKGPLYITQRIKDFTRAGEDAWLIGGTIDLGAVGLTGLSFDINASLDSTAGTNPSTGLANPKWREYDYDLIYRFGKDTWFDGMRVRLRYATLNEDYGTHTDKTTDFRVDLNWAVPFF